eukprot:TRINITY_DN53852_c0_g1_i1.p4 TRINITY_DN53852_c0_g1~~TRINITY_DN53852_c0_g1_i1.p4  ORF type:complete len:122 (-),score=15.61 TRINITY_DN53852_c0_g1_i1:69-434(-)
MLRAVLPNGRCAAAAWSDPEVRKLAAALWRDFVDPLAKGQGPEFDTARRALGLFRSEQRGVADVKAEDGAAPADWAFVPAADLFLIVGQDIVGVTVEGVFVETNATQRLSFATAIFQTAMA